MRTERLFGIVSALLSGDTVSAGKLAEKFSVSVRTIYRDIDILSVAGVPVYMKKGYGGGISILDNYRLGGAVLNDNEVENLLMSVGIHGLADPAGSDLLLEKLASVFNKHKVADWVEIDFTHWGTNKKNDKRMETIKAAILQRKKIQAVYFNSYGQKTNRVLAPIKLLFKSSAWYVSAYCYNKNSVRLFKIHRMKEIAVLDETFNRDAYLDLNPILKKSNKNIKEVELVLQFNSDVIYLLHDWYREDEISEMPDGNYQVKTIFPMDEWIYSHILSYGDRVKVISPEFIEIEIQHRLKNILKIYSNSE